MKNLFVITEEERKRILSLHENATKRQYLSEQYDPTIQVMVVGTGTQPSVIFDKKTMKAIRLANPVNDVKVRLDNANPQNRSDGETLAKNPVVQCQFSKIIAANAMITPEEINKCLNVNNSVQKKGLGDSNQTKCPVGDVNAVKAFQDWLDSRVSGWLPKYPDGLKKDPKKGYGMCGPNTRKAWSEYGERYKTNPEQNVALSSKPLTPQSYEDDVVIPNNTVNQGVTNPVQTKIKGTGGASGLGRMESNP